MVYVTKDSGKRSEYSTGMKRDVADGKARYDLLWVRDMPYDEQFMTRYAQLRERGAVKYCENMLVVNCELAETLEEYYRFRSSAARHFAQWISDDVSEDHSVACVFNMQMAEMVKWKMKVKRDDEQKQKDRAGISSSSDEVLSRTRVDNT
jgi:hypothetical protein